MWRKWAASNVVLSDEAIARTRRPVKDKGALMQTLHLWFRDLRAISLGQSPGRWPSPSMLTASTWKGAPPLPNHPMPTCAVGLRPERQAQNLDRCPSVGAGLFLALSFRGASICGAVAPDLRRVCPRQTADVIHQSPAPHKAGEIGGTHRQARASEMQCIPSSGLSFSFRPQRCGARAGRKKTVARGGDGSRTSRSEAPGLRPTGRIDPTDLRKRNGPGLSPSCAGSPLSVAGQIDGDRHGAAAGLSCCRGGR